MAVKNAAKYRKTLSVLTLACAGMLAAPHGVQAGFQFVPAPSQAPVIKDAPAAPAVTPSPVIMEDLPQIDDSSVSQTMTPMADARDTVTFKGPRVKPAEQQPVMRVRNVTPQQEAEGENRENFTVPVVEKIPGDNNAPAAEPSQTMQPVMTNNDAGSAEQSAAESITWHDQYEPAVGFGSDMPLALALRQVVPADYAYSFGPGVNPGLRVSWEGGRAWNLVVSDMIAPLGLESRVIGKTLAIKELGGFAPAMPAATPAQPPQEMAPMQENPQGKVNSMLEEQQKQMAMSEESNSSPRGHMGEVRRQNILDPGDTPINAMEESAAIPLLPEEPVKLQKSENLASVAVTASLPQNVKGQAEAPPPPSRIPEEKLTASEKMSRMPAPFDASPSIRIWEAHKGDSLKNTLGEWSRKAGVDFVWQAAHDYQIGADITVSDTFRNAVVTMFSEGMDPFDQPSLKLLDKQDGDFQGKLVVEDRVNRSAARKDEISANPKL